VSVCVCVCDNTYQRAYRIWYLYEQQWRHGIDPVVFHHEFLSNVIQLASNIHTSVIDDDVESFTVQRRLNRLHQTWVFRRVSYICSHSSTPYYNGLTEIAAVDIDAQWKQELIRRWDSQRERLRTVRPEATRIRWNNAK